MLHCHTHCCLPLDCLLPSHVALRLFTKTVIWLHDNITTHITCDHMYFGLNNTWQRCLHVNVHFFSRYKWQITHDTHGENRILHHTEDCLCNSQNQLYNAEYNKCMLVRQNYSAFAHKRRQRTLLKVKMKIKFTVKKPHVAASRCPSAV
jgi:hypothetical protein